MTTRDEIESLAADHALGLLEGERLAEAERLSTEDRFFGDMVATWRERLCELDATAVPAVPGPELWQRIRGSLETPAATAVPVGRDRHRPVLGARLWQSLPAWRAAGLTGLAASLTLALILWNLIGLQPAGPIYVAVLMTEANQAAAIVNTYRDGHAELIPLGPIAVPDGRALQVWTLWDRERGPVSVGLLDQARSSRLDVGRLPRAVPDQLFEISLEPKQGSPTGRPTGPVLMKGLTHTAL